VDPALCRCLPAFWLRKGAALPHGRTSVARGNNRRHGLLITSIVTDRGTMR
jgi:hypothetical protein